jgi:hypothetical protein
MALPHYIPLSQAAQDSRLSVARLKQLISDRIIRAIEVQGEIAIDGDAVRSLMRKEDLPEYKKFKHLKDKTLGIAEAARKYDIALKTMQQWVQREFIKREGTEGAQKVLINEQDVAYCVEIYKQAGKRKGRRLFNDDGTPYVVKHPDRVKE